METLADWAPNVKHPEKLAEYVRRKLCRTITSKFSTEEGVLPLTSIHPGLERNLCDAVQQNDEGSYLALEPSQAQVLINRLNTGAGKFIEKGLTPIVLAPNHLRVALSRFVERFVPGYAVICHQEIAPNTKVQSMGVISFDE